MGAGVPAPGRAQPCQQRGAAHPRGAVQHGARLVDGAGGGLDTSSTVTDTLRSNVISGNSAKWGGGVHAYGAAISLVGNRIQENNAPIHGGGLYIQGGWLRLENNDVLSNTADNANVIDYTVLRSGSGAPRSPGRSLAW